MKNKQISKTLEPTGDLCVKFTDEELLQLGLKQGDKLSFKEDGNGILLQKYETIELDLEELPREVLEMIIQDSCERDVSVNQVIENILDKYITKYEDERLTKADL